MRRGQPSRLGGPKLRLNRTDAPPMSTTSAGELCSGLGGAATLACPSNSRPKGQNGCLEKLSTRRVTTAGIPPVARSRISGYVICGDLPDEVRRRRRRISLSWSSVLLCPVTAHWLLAAERGATLPAGRDWRSGGAPPGSGLPVIAGTSRAPGRGRDAA